MAVPTFVAGDPQPSPPGPVEAPARYAQPSIEDLELVGHLKNLFLEARQAKRQRVAQWHKNYRILHNRTWKGHRPAWLPSPEVPEIYPIVASLVGWVCDQRPTWQIGPAADPHEPTHDFQNTLAQDLQAVMRSNWLVLRSESQVELATWDAFTYGTGIYKTIWDATIDDGQGAPTLLRVDPFTFYPDPQGTSERDCNYFFEVRNVSLQELDRRFPGAAELFEHGGILEDVDEQPTYTQDSSSTARANPGAITKDFSGNNTGATTPRYGRPGQSRLSAPVDDQGITLFECWLREHDFTDDEDGEPIVHDKWRLVVFAGNHILMDEPVEELWSNGRHPYHFYKPHENGEFWGVPLVELLAPCQLSINRMLSNIEHHVALTGNPVFKEGQRAGIQRTKIPNKPGARLTVSSQDTADWLQPPQLDHHVSELITFYINEMERISGLSAITRGQSPGGRNSADVVSSMQESSFVRVRMMLRNLEWSLRSAGEILAALIVEFYTDPRIVTIVGEDGEVSARALRSKHFYIPDGEGRNRTNPMKYSLLVDVGSSAATSRNQRFQDAKDLFAMGAMDVEGLLEISDWPNRRRLAARVEEKRAVGTLQAPGARQRAKRSS